MAVEKQPRLANQFWPIFFKQKLLIVVLSQIFITILIGAGIVVIGTSDIDLGINSLPIWILLTILLVVNMSVSIYILIAATKPTKDLMAAVVSVSGEKSDLTPPNPNTEQNERTGFRDALQTIYELANKPNPKPSNINADSQNTALESAINLTSCGFIALDKNRQVIFTNKSAPTHKDTTSKTVIDLLFNNSDNLIAWLDKCDEHSVHAEHVWTRIPDRLPNLEGRRFFDVAASYQKGAPVETVLILFDRTNVYSTDEENLDFISFAAHELRGPITVIKGYIDVLRDELSDNLQGDQQELFHRLVVSSNRLSGYVNNILNTSRYDRRHLKMHLAEDTLAAVYDEIGDDMQLLATTQNRLLSIDIPADLPTIAADRASIGEVLFNLIDNAIKYSNEGGTVHVTAKANGNFVDVSVIDNGIGMPESVVANLFQKFYRSHRSRETVSGTGIGLYISKAIVESHGGTISVRSQDGHGSTFTVSLPIYSTVADKLKTGNNSNVGLINEGNGWIKNHSMYRG